MLSALLTLALNVSSPVAARAPQVVMRYLVGLTLATPVLLAPLWGWATSGAHCKVGLDDSRLE